ncbi:MAG: prepilin-type N-terminal cleavage/methylation domain-containing protein [Proteobacteria bacterium]|nr:prepilin-type N-terminal cleavage/methylation domain-containing protein [Pseudomonadota bacterium]MBU1737287.1 prepilin-type N-terminal cleavage/methylation domain-containing protein [Pseudomonadota bacterium]
MKLVCGRSSTGNMAGFTIMEVLVAVTILGMAYLVILQSFSLSMQNIGRIDRSGSSRFEAMLEMEKHFLDITSDEEGEEAEGEIFVEDDSLKVIQFTDRQGLLFSLKLEKK